MLCRWSPRAARTASACSAWSDDLDLLRQKIAAVGDVRMVLVDPISAYLGVGKVDSFRTTDVRAVLAPVMDLARELEVAFIGIMHFNKKTDVTNALLRISDSLAFGAAARHVYAVVDDNENNRKVMVKGKNNNAPRDQKALAYTFATKEVATDPETGAPIIAPYIVWEPEHVDVTATEAMAAANEGRAPGARDKAIKFLQNELAVGPRAAKELTEMAEANDISKRTLKRAKSELGVITTKDGSDGGWTWRLPEEVAARSRPSSPQGCHQLKGCHRGPGEGCQRESWHPWHSCQIYNKYKALVRGARSRPLEGCQECHFLSGPLRPAFPQVGPLGARRGTARKTEIKQEQARDTGCPWMVRRPRDTGCAWMLRWAPPSPAPGPRHEAHAVRSPAAPCGDTARVFLLRCARPRRPKGV